MLFNEDLLNVSLRDYVIKSSNCRFSKQRLNTKVAEGQVGETFKQVDKILTILFLKGAGILGMPDERLNHAFGAL
jgi:hypothetical protein